MSSVIVRPQVKRVIVRTPGPQGPPGDVTGATVTSVAGRVGDVTLTKGDVGLSNVDNTADASKPVSAAQAAADTAVGNAAAIDATTKANAAQTSAEATAATALSTHAAATSSVHGISAFGATLVDDASASAARTTLGLGTAATAATGDFAAASHTHTLSNLTQSGATTGQVAQWNGTNWVPATASGGAILKVAAASSSTSGSTTTIIPLDNTTPQSSEGAEIITLSFTPTSASSRVLVFFNFCYSSNVNTPIAALFFDSDASATCSAFLNTVSSLGYTQNAHVMFDLPSWSGAKTIKIRAGPNFYGGAPAFFWNKITSGDVFNGTMKTTLTAIEYTP